MADLGFTTIRCGGFSRQTRDTRTHTLVRQRGKHSLVQDGRTRTGLNGFKGQHWPRGTTSRHEAVTTAGPACRLLLGICQDLSSVIVGKQLGSLGEAPRWGTELGAALLPLMDKNRTH